MNAASFHASDDWRTLAACADDDPNDWVWIVSHKPKDRARANVSSPDGQDERRR